MRVRSLGTLVEDSMRLLESIPRLGHQGARRDGPSVRPLLAPARPYDDDDTLELETVHDEGESADDALDYEYDDDDWL